MLGGWFPLRMFVAAMIEAMPRLKLSTALTLTSDPSRDINILEVVFSYRSSLEEGLNHGCRHGYVLFETSRHVLIIEAGLSFLTFCLTYPKMRTLPTTDGAPKVYDECAASKRDASPLTASLT